MVASVAINAHVSHYTNIKWYINQRNFGSFICLAQINIARKFS